MTTAIANSFNIFVDSERLRPPSSTGENLRLELGNAPITCGDNQFLRISLQSFNMYKTWYNVNTNNNVFRMSCPKVFSGGTNAPLDNQIVRIEEGNYATTGDLAKEFGFAVAEALSNYTGITCTLNVPNIHPVPGDNYNQTDNILDIRLDFATDPAFGADVPKIYFPIEDGDAYALIGGDRIIGGATDKKSIGTHFAVSGSSYKLLIVGHYPMQLTTERNVYIRTDLGTTNTQTSSYSARSYDSINGDNLMSSRILGVATIDNEFASYETNTQTEYFINLLDRSLVEMRLYIEDSKGRPIPSGLYKPHVNSDASTVPIVFEDRQNTLGNRNFQAVIKVDVVQHIGTQNNRLQSKPFDYSVSPRFGTEPLKNLDYGDMHYADPDYSDSTKFSKMKIKK